MYLKELHQDNYLKVVHVGNVVADRAMEINRGILDAEVSEPKGPAAFFIVCKVLQNTYQSFVCNKRLADKQWAGCLTEMQHDQIIISCLIQSILVSWVSTLTVN